MEFQYEYAGKLYQVNMTRDGEGFKARIGEKEYSVTSKEIKPGFFVLSIDGTPVKVSIATEGNHRHIFHDGSVYRFTRLEGRRKKGDTDGEISPDITSPISGKLVKVGAESGTVVEGGQTLMTIEAMKMEYQIKAPYDGKVEKINFKEGDQVDIGAVLIVMEKQAKEEKDNGSD